MKTKKVYIKPEVEEIELAIENSIMVGSGDSVGFGDGEHEGGAASSKKRDFWD